MGIPLGQVAMLNEPSRTRIAFDTVIGQETNAESITFAETMPVVSTHCDNPTFQDRGNLSYEGYADFRRLYGDRLIGRSEMPSRWALLRIAAGGR